MFYFVGYPRGIKSWLFYDLREQIVLVSTDTIFLEDNYIIDWTSNDIFDFRELSDTPRKTLEGISNPIEDIP